MALRTVSTDVRTQRAQQGQHTTWFVRVRHGEGALLSRDGGRHEVQFHRSRQAGWGSESDVGDRLEVVE
jgi:hypothetical protein